MYTLEQVIFKTNLIAPKRKPIVAQWLHDHNIITWEQLLSWRPHYSMTESDSLRSNEVWALYKIRIEEETIRYRKRLAEFDLYDSLRNICSRHEATRIGNILIANDIFSRQLLRSTSTDKLKSMKGIGRKSINILEKLKYLGSIEENTKN